MPADSPVLALTPQDVVFIGPAWAACWGALKARAKGLVAAAFAVPEPRAPESLVVYEGNGEWRPTAEKIYGKELADQIWSVSKRNYSMARELGKSAGALWSEDGTRWPNAPESKEPGLVLRRPQLEQFLASHVGAGALRASWDWRIRSVSPFEHEVSGLKTKTVCLVGDAFRPELFAFLRDKWVACTLSSFVHAAGVGVEQGSFFLFNGGADFAVREGQTLRVGSFRNLHSDRGVGFHDEPDELTRTSTEAYFTKDRWIVAGQGKPHLEIATLTCDGLPLIGPLPEAPGVFLAGGFSGRAPNFLFAVLEDLSDALAGRGTPEGLEKFSTKRFA
jgi:hypothetical protein